MWLLNCTGKDPSLSFQQIQRYYVVFTAKLFCFELLYVILFYFFYREQKLRSCFRLILSWRQSVLKGSVILEAVQKAKKVTVQLRFYNSFVVEYYALFNNENHNIFNRLVW